MIARAPPECAAGSGEKANDDMGTNAPNDRTNITTPLAGLLFRSGAVRLGTLLLVSCGGQQAGQTAIERQMSGVLCELPRARGRVYGRLGDIVSLTGGRVAIADLDRMTLVILSGEGVEVGTLGRRGTGPGEFRSITRVWPHEGDTIAVWDGSARRLSFMHGDGGFIRAWSPAASDGWARLVPMESLPNGRFLWGEFGVADVIAKRQVSRPPIRLYAGQPGRITPIGFSLDGPDVLRGGRGPTLGVSFGHTSLLTVVGDTIVVHDNATAVISRYNDGGELLNRLAVPGRGEPRVVDKMDVSRMRQERAARTRQVLARAPPAASLIRSYLRGLRDAPVARYMPFSDDLLSDSRGWLWIGEYVPPYDQSTHSRRWWVVDSDGAVRHEFHLPALARIGAISEEGFWVVVEDAEDGSTVVQRYCIGAGGTSCGPCRTTNSAPG